MAASFVLECSIGLIILNNSTALSPNPNLASAIIAQIAACVYCSCGHFFYPTFFSYSFLAHIKLLFKSCNGLKLK